MAVTLDDISRQAGVSKVTVSRALNRRGVFTRSDAAQRAEQIRSLASQMGYQPNWRARAFARRATRLIGWVSPQPLPQLSRIYLDLANSFAERLWKDRYQLMLVPTSDPDANDRDMIPPHQLDGIVGMDCLPESLLERLSRSGLPSVLINVGSSSTHGIPHVHVNDRLGGQLATKHLIERGHRRIGFLTRTAETDSPHSSDQDRQQGYQQVMQESGYPPIYLDRVEDVISLVRPDSRITAVVAYSDGLARRLIRGLWERGVRVPRDLSIVCFNNGSWLDDVIPPLTTVDVQQQQMGRLGAETLLSFLKTRATPPDQVVVPTLVVRRSTIPYHD